MQRVLVAVALGGLLLVGTPTLASSAERNESKADKTVAADKGDKGERGDKKGGDRDDKGDRSGHRGDKGERDRGDHDGRERHRHGHGHGHDRHYYGGGYYGEPYDCYYGRSGAYNCEPYGGDYGYGGYHPGYDRRYDGRYDRRYDGRYDRRYDGRSDRGFRNQMVTVSQMRFSPAEVYAYPGQEVLWAFRDGKVVHTVTANNKSFDSGKVTDGEYRLVFDQPGTYSYHCTTHPEMKGRVIVG